MTAHEVARVLSEIATLSELNGENPFRTRAFSNAARALEATDADLARLAREGKLTSIRGIGSGIAEVIRELVETGRSALHDELRTATPIGLFDLLRIPGVGAKRIHTLYRELNIDGLDALETAARAGRIAALSGFGAKTEQKILDGIGFVRTTHGRRRYPAALEAAVKLLEWLRARPCVAAAEIAGAIRRRAEVVEAIDLVAAAEDPELVIAEVERSSIGLSPHPPSYAECGMGNAEWNHEPSVPHSALDIPRSQRAVGWLSDGLPVRVRIVEPARFVAATFWETGNEAHLRGLQRRAEGLGMQLDEAGLWRADRLLALPTERALYDALDLTYVPPELREGTGEVSAAAAGDLPRLIELEDLRGTFHCHTTYSDGKATVAEMAEAARTRGWSYLGLGDHSRSAAYAGGLSPAAVRKQHREIDTWQADHGDTGRKPFRLFKGIESDILPDGSLDYEDEVLASFDYVVGSVHGSFGMSEGEMTKRVIRAVENPHLTILGHPTGRLLLVREGYAIDVPAVLDACAEHGVVVEINADPHRLDLDWRHLRAAAERGVLIAINPDAHSIAGLGNVAFGVNVARKGWIEAPRVLNTWPLDKVEAFFAERKQSR